jgi:hypothetical protein
VIGDGVGEGEGRVVSREIVVSRTIEGEVTLSMESAAESGRHWPRVCSSD